MRWVEEWTKSQAWGCPCHPQEISKRYKHQSLGMPSRHPLLHRQKSGHLSKYYIFIASCIMRFSWSVSCFCFQFSFCFVCCNKWLDHIMFFLEERDLFRFSFPRTLQFSLFSFNECSLFLLLRLAFVFRLDFCSDLAIYLHQGVFGPMVHVGFHQKSCFKKGLNGVGKEKKSFIQKSGTKRSLCRLRPRLLHVVLDVVLIVCLVVLL
jgi:hypothetical protein